MNRIFFVPIQLLLYDFNWISISAIDTRFIRKYMAMDLFCVDGYSGCILRDESNSRCFERVIYLLTSPDRSNISTDKKRRIKSDQSTFHSIPPIVFAVNFPKREQKRKIAAIFKNYVKSSKLKKIYAAIWIG